jgi:hypothetical protein
MVARLEVELRPFTDLPQDLGVLFGFPVGRGRVGQVRKRRQQLFDPLLDAGQLLLQ